MLDNFLNDDNCLSDLTVLGNIYSHFFSLVLTKSVMIKENTKPKSSMIYKTEKTFVIYNCVCVCLFACARQYVHVCERLCCMKTL